MRTYGARRVLRRVKFYTGRARWREPAEHIKIALRDLDGRGAPRHRSSSKELDGVHLEAPELCIYRFGRQPGFWIEAGRGARESVTVITGAMTNNVPRDPDVKPDTDR